MGHVHRAARFTANGWEMAILSTVGKPLKAGKNSFEEQLIKTWDGNISTAFVLCKSCVYVWGGGGVEGGGLVDGRLRGKWKGLWVCEEGYTRIGYVREGM